MSELVLALSDARLGALADVLHVVLVQLAQLLLALRQAHQLAAQRLRADDVGLRDQYGVHGQRPRGHGGERTRGAVLKGQLQIKQLMFSEELTVSDMMLRFWNTSIQQMQQKEARTSTVRMSERMEKHQK